MGPAAHERLEAGLAELGIGPDSSDALPRLAAYLDLLLEWNTRMNLVGPVDEVEAVPRHLLDSLVGLSEVRENLPAGGSCADVGFGAGLPGIPIALAGAIAPMVLVERSAKKCTFLRHTVETLEMRGVSVVVRDLRELGDRFDVLLVRAVSNLTAPFCELLDAHLRPGGAVILYKGRREVIDRELAAVPMDRFAVNVRGVSVPFLDAERHLVTLKRVRR